MGEIKKMFRLVPVTKWNKTKMFRSVWSPSPNETKNDPFRPRHQMRQNKNIEFFLNLEYNSFEFI